MDSNASSIDILAANGKSFYFAGILLPQKKLKIISELYWFCRYVDDCADTLPAEQARKEISQIKKMILSSYLDSSYICSQPISSLQQRIYGLTQLGISSNYLLDLIRGTEIDVNNEVIRTEQDLDTYCYHVAGVVGLMMNPLIDVTAPEAHPYAVALGKGMQLTNICRDILEDAINDRYYIPLKEIQDLGIDPLILKRQGETPSSVKLLVKKYLQKADAYYFEAYQGLHFIPLRCRFVILLAGELYRHIGIKIIKNNYEVLSERTYLNLFEKIVVAITTIPQVFRFSFWKRPKNISTLGVNL